MKRILIVDDEESLLAMMVETLQILGFETLAAADGTRGIELAVQQVPDLILCDLNMPSVDGLETLKAIRSNASTATIPFVLLSGFADSATRQRAEKLGASDIITKPFSTSELMNLLNRGLEKTA